MRIFVDADACPKIVKEILYRVAIRTETELILVANQYLKVPRSHLIRIIQVSKGFDVADNRIVEEIEANDVAITADIPLASAIINKGGIAINPRGQLYTNNNIKQQLASRDLMEYLRDSQMVSGGPKEFTKNDGQLLANQLDRLLNAKK